MVGIMERNAIEITKADLQRMRGSPPNNRRARLLKEKLELKALSDERAQRWPNTIKALHEKRIHAKKEEQENLERERLALDAREAKLKAEKRRELIERANKMLLLPHMTGLLLKRQRENTGKEREAQIQYKKRMEEGWKRQEEKFVQMEKKQLEKWDKEEELKLQKQKEQVKALAKGRHSQIKLKQEQEMQTAADEKYEAERSWERAWQCKMEFEASERERFLKNKAFAEHHKKTMGLNQLKEMEAIKHDKEDERRALQRMEDEEVNGLTLEDIKL